MSEVGSEKLDSQEIFEEIVAMLLLFYEIIYSHRIAKILYEVPAIEKKPDNGRYLGIDLGVSNFATVVSNTGENPYIINGKGLKAINQYWNKQNAIYTAAAEVANAAKETARLSRLVKWFCPVIINLA